MKTPQQGAATSLVAAFEASAGRYLEDCNEAETVANDAQASHGVREWALDPDAATRLWKTSLALLETPVPRVQLKRGRR